MKTPGLAPDLAILRSLLLLRWLAIAAQLAVILTVHYALGLTLPIAELGLVVALLAMWNTLSWLWQKRPTRHSNLLLCLQLAVDIAALTALLYFAGGPANPFISLYLVSIALAAAVLPVRYALAITALCAGAYSLLMVWHLPLPQLHHGNEFQLHMLGMWVNFLLSAAIIALFVSLLARLLRERERELTDLREARLQDEQLLALGTLAASTAHALGTPLNTLSIGIEELREGQLSREEITAELDSMQQQTDTCRRQLDELRHSVWQQPQPLLARGFLRQSIDAWELLNPQMELAIDWQISEQAQLLANTSLRHVIGNLLDNAARASIQCHSLALEIHVESTDGGLWVHIDDHGPGIAQETLQASLERRSNGLGLLLSHASIDRLGGEISLQPRPGGGTRTSIRLPLAEATP